MIDSLKKGLYHIQLMWLLPLNSNEKQLELGLIRKNAIKSNIKNKPYLNKFESDFAFVLI